MGKLTRREALNSMVAGGTAMTLTGIVQAKSNRAEELTAMNQTQSSNTTGATTTAATAAGRAFSGQHQPKPLPFNPAKLNGLSEKLIRSHWENNYGGAVKALNAVEQRLGHMLQDKELPPYIYGDLKREELVRTGSVVLHENYFVNLGGDGKPGGKILDLIKVWFGSFETWEAEFRKTANALAGGSGWTILTYNLHTSELHNYWSWDHMHNAPMGLPLLVLDMYEHAYHMDYGAAAAKYIDAFMQNVNWEEVNRRAETALKMVSG